MSLASISVLLFVALSVSIYRNVSSQPTTDDDSQQQTATDVNYVQQLENVQQLIREQDQQLQQCQADVQKLSEQQRNVTDELRNTQIQLTNLIKINGGLHCTHCLKSSIIGRISEYGRLITAGWAGGGRKRR